MKRRVWIISLVLSLAFAGIAVRLFQLQVIDSRDLSIAAVAQRAHGIALEDARGQIRDRNRIPLTDSRLVNAVVFPSLVKDAGVTAFRLSQALGVDRHRPRAHFRGKAGGSQARTLPGRGVAGEIDAGVRRGGRGVRGGGA